MGLFHDELPISWWIRHRRLGRCGDYYSVFKRRGADKRCVLFPLPLTRGVGARLAELPTYFASTAWPLLQLLRGMMLEEAFGPHLRSHATARLRRGRLDLMPASHLRYCASCRDEQRTLFHTTWWMVVHNMPLTAACPIHGTALHYSPIECIRAGDAPLPHEIEGHLLVPVDGDMRAIRIARAVHELRLSARLIDPVAFHLELATLQAPPAPTTTTARRLGAACAMAHERITGIEPVINCSLSSAGNDDLMLARIATGEQDIDALITMCRAALAPFWVAEADRGMTLDEVLRNTGVAQTRWRHDLINEFCQQEQRSANRDVRTVAIVMLRAMAQLRRSCTATTGGCNHIDPYLQRALLTIASQSPYQPAIARASFSTMLRGTRAGPGHSRIERCRKGASMFLHRLSRFCSERRVHRNPGGRNSPSMLDQSHTEVPGG